VDKRIKGHKNAVSDLKGDPSVGKLMAGVIPANEDISYSHSNHMSVMQYNPVPKPASLRAFAFDLAKRAFAKGGK
jgi:hypothetical protein